MMVYSLNGFGVDGLPDFEVVGGLRRVMSYNIYLLSDATGETVERVVRAAQSQFKDVDIKLHRMNRLRSRDDIVQAVETAVREPGILIHTLVNPEHGQLLRDLAEGRTLGDTTTLADAGVVETIRTHSGSAEE